MVGNHGQYWKVSVALPQEDDVVSLFGDVAFPISYSGVPVCQFRPNPDIRLRFDDDVPIVRQTPQGPAFVGRVIPPPNWAESTLYRAASSAGACYRNSQGDLLVRVRTWVIEHVDGGRFAPRDFTLRAQLLVRLREKIKRVWQDVIGRNDHLGGQASNSTLRAAAKINQVVASNTHGPSGVLSQLSRNRALRALIGL